jgi:hypothetical protein
VFGGLAATGLMVTPPDSTFDTNSERTVTRHHRKDWCSHDGDAGMFARHRGHRWLSGRSSRA